MYDKQKVAEFKEMLKEYRIHTYRGGDYFFSEFSENIDAWLESQVAPEYPCPVCGEEMVLSAHWINADDHWRGFCNDCKINSYYYSGKPKLRKALQEHWEKTHE